MGLRGYTEARTNTGSPDEEQDRLRNHRDLALRRGLCRRHARLRRRCRLRVFMRANPQYGGNCRYFSGGADGDRVSRPTGWEGQPAALAKFPAVFNQLFTRPDITSLAAISQRFFSLLEIGSLYPLP